MDYRNYHFSKLEHLKVIGIAAGITAMVAYLFYASFWGTVIFPIVYYAVKKFWKKEKLQKRKACLCMQFQDAMQSVSSSLLAGYSLENAWREAQKEVEELHGKESYIAVEFQQMNRKVEMRNAIEDVLYDFSMRSGIEDISTFAEVFRYAKRSGGNFISMIERTTSQMKDKLDTEEEIRILVASKRLEQRIMDVFPILILAYLKITNKDYLNLLYGNPLGVLFMTVSLCVYLVAIWISTRILDIQI